MFNIDNNMGKGTKCECGKEETTEHIVECEDVERIMESKIKIG